MQQGFKPKFIIKKPDSLEAETASKLIEKESNMVNREADFIEGSSYFIALDNRGRVAGVIGMIDWEFDGVELVSHVVDESYRSMGVGKLLFEHLLKETEKLESPRLFLCTTKVEFYKKLGFVVSSPEILSDKIRSDCARCPKGPFGPGFGQCPEVVMIYQSTKEV